MRGLWAGTCALVALIVCAPAASASWWAPPKNLSWYWQLSGTVNNSRPAAAYDIDGFGTSASEVSALHAAGKHVICYVDVGTYEPGRPDSGTFPAALLGNDVQGWPGEKWLDVRPSGPFYSTLQAIMAARFTMCAAKHFDAVEPDNIDSFDGNNPGFSTSASDQAAYNAWVANEVHSLGMAVLQKNDPTQAAQLQPYFDGVLNEQCNESSECSSFKPYLDAGKPVLNAEYNLSTSQFCAADNNAGIMGALYNLSLNGGTYTPCWSGAPGFGGGSTGGPTGSRPPKGTSPIDRIAPRVTITSRKLRYSRGSVRLQVACARGQSYCDGIVTLRAVRRGAGLLVGSTHFHIAGGHSGSLRIAISRSVLRRLRRSKSVTVEVTVRARNRAGHRSRSSRRLKLQLSGPHKR